jgi:N-acetylglucosaminyl-diphospho-decaprenol L-rhamnosyltransferase
MRLDVSVVVVSWNTRQRLERCLAALSHAAPRDASEIVVVDNGSTDGSQAMVTERFPGVRLIQNRDNLGYGRAVNIGVKAGTGRAVLILNSDCEPAPGALALMLEKLDREPSAGGLFCKLLNPDGSLQPSVHERFPSPWGMLGDVIGLSSLRHAVYRRPWLHRWLLRATLRLHERERDVEWGGGACMLVRRSAFDAVGGFDERFFMYYEDMDLCHRLRDAGHRLLYMPAASAVHHWGKSSAQVPERMLVESYRSRMQYFERYYPGWGGELSRWAAQAELHMRRVLLTCAALIVPGRRDRARKQAEAGRDCLRTLQEQTPAEVPKAGMLSFNSLALACLLVIGFSLFRYLHDVVKIVLESPFIDFAHYYTYTYLVGQGLNPFDPQAVAMADDVLKIRRAGAAANYPPLFYLLMQPWAWMPFHFSALAWSIVGQVSVIAAVGLCLSRWTTPNPLQLTAALFVALNYQPVFENLALGQANAVLLLLVTLAWWGLRSDRHWLTAGLIGLAPHIKIQYGLLILLLWGMGYRTVCARAAVVAGLGTGIGMLVLGGSHYLEYLRYIAAMPDYLATWSANLSLSGTLNRLLLPLEHGHAIAVGAILAASLAILIVFARAIPRSIPPDSQKADWAWSLGLCAMLLVSPLTEEHHLVVLLFPLLRLLCADVPLRAGEIPLALGAVILLGSRYSLDRFPMLHEGPLSLLTTGKLLGIVALAWLLVRRLRAGEPR